MGLASIDEPLARRMPTSLAALDTSMKKQGYPMESATMPASNRPRNPASEHGSVTELMFGPKIVSDSDAVQTALIV